MSILIKAISAMEKCFMDEEFGSKKAITRGEALLGEEFSFEVAYTSDEPAHHPKARFRLNVVSPLKKWITVRTVEQVPVRLPAYRWSDDYYLRKTPGFYPDRAVVHDNGRLTYSDGRYDYIVVRPAFWLNLESDFF